MRALLRAVCPPPARRRLRDLYDSLYCRNFEDKETFGTISPWTIRTRGLTRHSVVYSGGIGQDISFEIALGNRFGLSVFAFDPSEVASRTVACLQGSEARHIRFQALGLAGTSGTLACAVGGSYDGAGWVRSGKGASIACTTIHEQMLLNGHSRIDVLKLDIEGFEYGVLADCLEKQLDINQVCVEFHHFFEDIPRMRTVRVVKELCGVGYQIIHKHDFEMTFWRPRHP